MIKREIVSVVEATLKRGKSILLLGPRQSGKTTLIESAIKPDIHLSFVDIQTKQSFERDIVWSVKELLANIESFSYTPIVFIDEVQKVPKIMDSIQDCIDRKKAVFILSGSSARKLKYGKHVNMLPGRVVLLQLGPLTYREMQHLNIQLIDILNFGSLPAIALQSDQNLKEIDLASYVSIYLEEEIRLEAIVRNVGHFSRFLQLAASESGNTINASKLSQEIGVSASTIQSYYQILEDCLIAIRIDPFTESRIRRRVIKTPKYIFFDLGVRRVAANEGINPTRERLGQLFEQYVGLEIIQYLAINKPISKLYFWRSLDGPEVDWVIEVNDRLIPIEVKLTEQPKEKHIKHLQQFIIEHNKAKKAFLICDVKQKIDIEDNIIALPWRNFVDSLFI